jgi:hypothetical protein
VERLLIFFTCGALRGPSADGRMDRVRYDAVMQVQIPRTFCLLGCRGNVFDTEMSSIDVIYYLFNRRILEMKMYLSGVTFFIKSLICIHFGTWRGNTAFLCSWDGNWNLCHAYPWFTSPHFRTCQKATQIFNARHLSISGNNLG